MVALANKYNYTKNKDSIREALFGNTKYGELPNLEKFSQINHTRYRQACNDVEKTRKSKFSESACQKIRNFFKRLCCCCRPPANVYLKSSVKKQKALPPTPMSITSLGSRTSYMANHMESSESLLYDEFDISRSSFTSSVISDNLVASLTSVKERDQILPRAQSMPDLKTAIVENMDLKPYHSLDDLYKFHRMNKEFYTLTYNDEDDAESLDNEKSAISQSLNYDTIDVIESLDAPIEIELKEVESTEIASTSRNLLSPIVDEEIIEKDEDVFKIINTEFDRLIEDIEKHIKDIKTKDPLPVAVIEKPAISTEHQINKVKAPVEKLRTDLKLKKLNITFGANLDKTKAAKDKSQDWDPQNYLALQSMLEKVGITLNLYKTADTKKFDGLGAAIRKLPKDGILLDIRNSNKETKMFRIWDARSESKEFAFKSLQDCKVYINRNTELSGSKRPLID